MQPPIRFGTDGWRGVIAEDFTFARLAAVAPVAAQVLADEFADTGSNTIIVGYDRRFLSPEFAQRTAEVVAATGFDVQLAQTFAPTPAFSWAAYAQKALGALVITASHNPAAYSGLKMKGAFGGSVSPEVTQKVEDKLETLGSQQQVYSRPQGKITSFDAWDSYCQVLRSKVDVAAIQTMILSGKLTVFVDVMHGAAAGGLAQVLEMRSPDPSNTKADTGLIEINSNADPLFGGGAPEPLPCYISELLGRMKTFHAQHPDQLSVGFVFDGDADRIAAVDSRGNFLSSQVLIPVLIDHLAKRRGLTGELIKTISGSDLMPKIAALYNLSVYETPVGYKYIAERMLEQRKQGHIALIGGEESGGIGYGTHIPERDALLSALYVLEAIARSQQDLSQIYQNLQDRVGFQSHYDRIDKHLSGDAAKQKLLQQLQTAPFTEVAGRKVIDINAVDGFKFRLEDGSWLLIRFSGTEPVLRLYCEAANFDLVQKTLTWIGNLVEDM